MVNIVIEGAAKMFKRSPNLRSEIKIFDIESLMPKDHLLRKIDKVINLEEIYKITEKYYS